MSICLPIYEVARGHGLTDVRIPNHIAENNWITLLSISILHILFYFAFNIIAENNGITLLSISILHILFYFAFNITEKLLLIS